MSSEDAGVRLTDDKRYSLAAEHCPYLQRIGEQRKEVERLRPQNRQQENRRKDHWLNRADHSWMVIIHWDALRCTRGCPDPFGYPSFDSIDEHLEGQPEKCHASFVANPGVPFEYNDPAATRFGPHLLLECSSPIEPSRISISEVLAEIDFRLVGEPIVITQEEYLEGIKEVVNRWASEEGREAIEEAGLGDFLSRA